MRSLPHNVQGIIWALTYCFAGAIADTSSRYVMDSGLHFYQTVFFRCALPMLMFLPFIVRTRKQHGLLPSKPLYYAGMAFFLLVAVAAFYKALTCLPLPQIAALSFISTLLTVFFAVIMFKEQLKFYRIAGLLAGFVGALTIIRPGLIPFDPCILYSLLASASWTTFILLTKKISAEESPIRITFYPLVFITPIALPFALVEWQWPTLYQWLGIMLNALGIMIVFTVKSKAFALADLSTVMPIDFSYLIFMSIIGYLLFGEVLDFWTFVGAFIIIASASYIVRSETKKHTAQEADISH